MIKRLFKFRGKKKSGSSNKKPRVSVEDNIIKFDGLDKGSFEVYLDKLEVIQLIKNRDNTYSLFFFDIHQKFIPLETQGLSEVLKTLEKKLNIPKISLKGKFDNRGNIWKKTFEKNYEIGTNPDYSLTKGIFVKENELFNWNYW